MKRQRWPLQVEGVAQSWRAASSSERSRLRSFTVTLGKAVGQKRSSRLYRHWVAETQHQRAVHSCVDEIDNTSSWWGVNVKRRCNTCLRVSLSFFFFFFWG